MKATGLPFAILVPTAWAFCGEALEPESAGPTGQRAFDELGAYYRDAKRKPSHDWALGDLASKDAAARQRAGAYLLALFRQSAADEHNGRSPWQQTPFWGEVYRSDAREFRKELAAAFGKEAQGAEALDAALWLIDEEQTAELQAQGIKALRRIRVPQSAELFKKILAEPHPNVAVTTGAIEEAGQRGLKGLALEVLRLCSHYRTSIREAARAAAPRLGIVKLPDFNPEEAFTPDLDKALKSVAEMVLTPIPRDAKWVRFTYKTRDRRVQGKPEEQTFSAWLLAEEKGEYRVLDHFAAEWSLPKPDTTLAPRTLFEEVQALRDLRSKDRLALSREGPATGQFDPEYLSLPEALIAAWSYARGDRKTAAFVLFPRLDAMERDDWLVGVVAGYLAQHYFQLLLDAFSYDRDYEAAIEYATHLSKPFFDGFRYRAEAQELGAQLAKRSDDFKTLTLPKPGDWEALKKTIPRPKQIEYLAQRLRLLNCHQLSQPGDVHYAEPQFAEPRGQGPAPKQTPVINPYTELGKMGLEPADLSALVPFLADESFMPMYSYWRRFHPSRTLHRVNWAVARIVSSVAMRDLPDLKTYNTLDEVGKKKHIEAILAWCKANAGRTRTDLALELMAKTQKWNEFAYGADVAVRARAEEALGLLVRRMADFPKNRDDIAEFCFIANSPKAVPEARTWAKDKEDGVRFWAALILLRRGDKAKLEGLPELKSVLERDEEVFWYPRAFEDLMATGREEAIKVACSVVDRKKLSAYRYEASPLLQRLFLAGRQESLDYLLKELSNSEAVGALERADYAAQIVVPWRTDGLRYDSWGPPAERVKEREVLKTWLRRTFEQVKAGQKPDGMRAQPLPLVQPRRPQWRVDAAGR